MYKGTVLLYKDFTFSNGQSSDKLFVVLSNETEDGEIIFAKTTSQISKIEKRLKIRLNMGCNTPNKLFYVKKGNDLFDKDTIIEIGELFQLKVVSILNNSFHDQCRVVCYMPDELFKDLVACLSDYKDDIEYFMHKYIFE
jgi:hypothetical protein